MIKKLIGIRLRSAFLSFLSGKDKNGNPKPVSTGKIALYTLLYAFVGLTFLFLMFTGAISAALLLVPGADELYFGIFMLLSLTVLFFLSIFETKSELFDCKDNDLLFALPIKEIDIMVSRIFTVLIFNYIAEAIIMLPVTVVYLIMGGNIIGILGSALIFLTIPLLATVLASGVGYLVAVISKRFKYKTIVSLILSIAFIVAYFVGYSMLLGTMDTMPDEDFELDLSAIKASYRAVCVIGEVCLLSPIPTLIYVFAVALVSFLASYIISKNYGKIITGTVSTAKREYRAERLEKRSTLHALVRKEFSRLTSSAAYMLNGATGLIFLVLIVGAVALNSDAMLTVMNEILGGMTGISASEMIVPLLTSALCMLSGMNMLSASALSLEGNSLWILKTVPVSSKEILIAKTVPHILVCAPITSIGGIILAIATGAPLYAYLFYIATPFFANVLFAFLGILLNVAFPKFEYINEAQVVKQSAPVFLSMLIATLFGMILIIGSLVLTVIGAPIIANVITLLLTVGLSIGLYFFITGPAARKLDRI